MNGAIEIINAQTGESLTGWMILLQKPNA